MSKKRYSAEEAAELLISDNDPDGNDLESLHPKTTCNLLVKIKFNQFYQTLTLLILNLAWLAVSLSLSVTMNWNILIYFGYFGVIETLSWLCLFSEISYIYWASYFVHLFLI